MDAKHETNRQHWDRAAERWRGLRDRDGLWRRCHIEPELAFEGGAFDEIRTAFPGLEGRAVLVVGSGDYYVAFALAGCGAEVTSVDISQRQLDVAAERADELGLRSSSFVPMLPISVFLLRAVSIW